DRILKQSRLFTGNDERSVYEEHRAGDMGEIQSIGRFLVIAGIVLAAVGGLLLLAGKVPWIGRLPGDIFIQRKNFTFYFPLATSILLSLLLTLLFWLIGRK
ncbi:MAG: DUF2905 domain-containing protein, partial [Thermodesulfovibrionales bacterium]